MIGITSMAAVLVAISGMQATGDFDGDGIADTARIVARPGGGREVVVSFGGREQEVRVSRVDAQAVLSVVPPPRLADLCVDLVRVVRECAMAQDNPRRAGLAFKRMQGEVVGTALWNGTGFTMLMSLDVRQDGSLPARSALPAQVPETRQNIVASPGAPASGATRRTVLSLDIGANGMVTACRVAAGSGFPELDAEACAIATERARYGTPDGRAVPPQTRQLSIAWPSER